MKVEESNKSPKQETLTFQNSPNTTPKRQSERKDLDEAPTRKTDKLENDFMDDHKVELNPINNGE